MPPHVKTSIAPGSRIASDYFATNSLQESLDALGFETVGYGCTTCIGNSGPLNPELEQAVRDNDIVAASVLSGNRNFEARIHASIKTNFLMSPPLVVAFALAGRVDIDFDGTVGHGPQREPRISEGHLAQLRGNCGSRCQIPQPGSIPGALHHHAGQESPLGGRIRAGRLCLPVE